jgi:hypothetical protein
MGSFPGCPGHAAHINYLLSRPHCSKFGLPYFVLSIPMICNAAETQTAYCKNYLIFRNEAPQVNDQTQKHIGKIFGPLKDIN